MATYTNQKEVQTGLTLKLTVTQNGSSCNAKLQMIIATNYSFSASYWSYELRGDASASGSSGYASYSAGTYTLLDKDFTKSGSFSVTGNLYVPWFGWNVNVTVSGGQTKPTFKDLTIYARGEHSIRVEWEASDVIDLVTYKIKPSGGSWTENTVSGHNNDNGYFTIQNLTENKKYYIYVKVRRKSDGLESNWSEQSTITTYSAPTQTIDDNTNITETSITVNWSCDSNVIKYKYSLDGGDTWSGEHNTSGRIGSYTINGLTPGDTYNIKTSLERETTYWSNTTTLSKKTYNYPYVTSTPDFKIGDGVHIGIYNPLYRTCNVYLIGDNNSQIGSAETETESGVNFNGNYYSSIPNKKKGQYKIRLKCDEVSRDTTIDGGYYEIRGNEYPTFNSNQWSFTTGYDKNNKVIIKNKSSLSVKVNSAGSSNYGASISKYVVKWGNNNPVEITNISDSANFDNGDNSKITVTAVDSRELSTDTTQDIEVIDYKDQECTITAKRTNGVGEDVKLSLNGSYKQCQLYTDSTHKADNTILSVKYYIKSGNDWGTPYTIPLNQLTIGSGSFSLSNYQIYSDGSSTGFTIGTRYNLKVEIEDRYQPKSFEYVITDGKIAVDCYQDSNGDYHRGVNGLANSGYAQTINGDEYVTGLLQYGSSGRRDYNEAGFTYDQYSNMTHRRSNSNDNWSMNKYDRTKVLQVLPEQSKVEVFGEVNVDKGNNDSTIYLGSTSYNNTNNIRTRNSNIDIGIGTDSNSFRMWDYTHSKEIMRTDGSGNTRLNGTITYQHSNEINFSGGTQNQCIFNYRNADTDGYDSSATCEYWFCNYNGRDVSKSTLVAGNVDAHLKYDVLYNNTSGTNGSFDTSYGYFDWYDHVIVYFKNNDGKSNAVVVYTHYSSNNPIVLMANHNNDDAIWIKTKEYTLWSRTAESTSNGREAKISGGGVSSPGGNNIYVTRVEGYK